MFLIVSIYLRYFYDSVIHLVDNSLKYLFLFISDKVANEILLLSESNFPNNNS